MQPYFLHPTTHTLAMIWNNTERGWLKDPGPERHLNPPISYSSNQAWQQIFDLKLTWKWIALTQAPDLTKLYLLLIFL